MRKKVWLIVGALILSGGWFYWRRQSANPKDIGEIIKVRRGPLEETVEATGNISPLNRVEIKPSISGRIEKYLVDEGDSVKAGQVIAWMSSSDRVAIMDAARSQGHVVLKKWEDSYKPTPVIAPISGVIILRNIVAGQTVDASTVLFAMSDQLIVVAQVDETDIGRIHIGMPAKIILDAYPDRATIGKVFNILHEGINTSNVITYNVKINPDGKVPGYYKSQMTANVSFIVKENKNALFVPAIAVSEKNGHSQVLIPGLDGKSVPHSVSIGITDRIDDEITSGLSEGDLVVIGHNHYVPKKAQTSPLAFGGKKKK
jgi:macrolide-specific efflux system membrane fusion protein